MSKVAWLHLSDLHFRSTKQHEWDADIVLRELLRDVQGFTRKHGLTPDLILVSGDIAFSGVPADYDLARAFFDSLLAVTGLAKDRVFLVPGNHDANRSKISQGAKAHASWLKNRQAMNDAMSDELDRRGFLRRFDDYRDFLNSYLDGHIVFDDERYFYVHTLEVADVQVEVLGLNSAWLAHGGHEEHGCLALGERQIRAVLEACGNADFRIALLHHPFEWMQDFDSQSCKPMLMDHCDFFLTGHLHQPAVGAEQTPDASVMNIAAGACYETREYRNSYNLVCLDLENLLGTVFLRGWTDREGGFWTEDAPYRNIRDGMFTFPLSAYSALERTPRVLGMPMQAVLIGDSPVALGAKLSQCTRQVLEQIHPYVPGINGLLLRDAAIQVEDLLTSGRPVVLTGGIGTGKSGVGVKLVQLAQEKGSVVLYLDASWLGPVQSELDLAHYLGIEGPVHSALERVSHRRGCRLIIDQLDSIAGLSVVEVLLRLALECSQVKGIEVVVISRKEEQHERDLIHRLSEGEFVEVTSPPLTESEAGELLDQLGIAEPSAFLLTSGRNFLSLELIGSIKQQRPDFDFSAVIGTVDLWEQYVLASFGPANLPPDSSAMSETLAKVVALARAGLTSGDRTFSMDDYDSDQIKQLIDQKVIVCDDDCRCRFRHGELEDFLYAWDATWRKAMPSAVLSEVGLLRAANVLRWMDRIYAHHDPELRKQLLRGTEHA